MEDKAGKVLGKAADFLVDGVDPVRVAERIGDEVLTGFRCTAADCFFMPGEAPK